MNNENRLSSLKGKTVGKLLVVLFAALLCSVLVLATADDSAASPVDEFEFEGINYVVTSEVAFGDFDGTVKVGDNRRFLGDLIIPDQVTADLKTYSVTAIGDYAFYECFGLTSITIGNSVTSIGDEAFQGAYFLTSVVIPDSVTFIGDAAFMTTGLTSVTIPESVTSIGIVVFVMCPIESFEVSPDNASYSNDDQGILYNKDKTILIQCPGAFIGDVEIPDTVITIGMGAFAYCPALTSVVIPNSVTSIGEYAFVDCNSLISVNIPDGVTSIGESAFEGCISLESVNILDGVTSIGESAFSCCDSLISVIIPNSVTSIGDYAFAYCIGLESIDIPGSVTSIGKSAFENCYSLISVNILYGVTSIDNYAFENCDSLISVTIPNSVTFIGVDVFAGATFYYTDGVTEITADVENLAGHSFTGTDYSDLTQKSVVIFKYGRITIQNIEVDYGAEIIAPSKLKRSPTAESYFAFEWVGYSDGMTAEGNVTFVGVFTEVVNKYTITWIVNGTETTTEVAYGTLPSYGDNPVKAATDEFTYTFTEFTPTIVNVIGVATYTAQFSEETNEYTITWIVDGIETTTEVAYGTVPTFDGTPTKDATDQYTYTFVNFVDELDVEPVAVTGIATYTAQFSHVTNEYTITWIVNGNETTTEVAFGIVPTFDGTPTKAPTDQYTYTFVNFVDELDVEPVAVTGIATYTAQFSHVTNEYTITWIVEEDEFQSEETLNYGVSIDAPEYLIDSTPQFDYEFAWDGYTAGMTVEGNATFYGVITEVTREYTITWIVDGIETTTEVAYGTVPTFDGTPTKAPTDQYTYTFVNFVDELDVEPVAVTGIATYTAQFSHVTNEYTITWIVNGNETTTEVAFGIVPTFDGTPTKAPTDQYTYTFVNFVDELDVEPVAVTGIATYTAQFSHVTNEYTITWIVEEDEFQSEETLNYGVSIDAPEYLIDSTPQFDYEFAWDGYTAGMTVEGNATFYGVITEVTREYTITWIVDGIETTTEVAYGTVPTFDGTPTKAPTDQYTYTFVNFVDELDVEPVAVTGIATYTAQFSHVTNEYTITWIVNGNETTTEVAFGIVPTFDGTPTKAPTDQYTYTFVNFVDELDVEPVAVTGIATYTAQFSHVTNEYTITWIVEEDEFQSEETLNYGVSIDAPEYLIDSTPQFDYEFAWDGYTAGMTVEGNATFYGVITEVTREYTITWIVDGIETTTEIAYGDTPAYGPTVIAYEFTYTNVVWDNTPVAVTGIATYTAAEFVKNPSVYTITFKFGDITFKKQNLDYDATIIAPGNLSKDSTPEFDYTFEWVGYTAGMTVEGNATFNGEFTEVTREYTITWKVEGSDDVTKDVAFGIVPTFDGTPTRDATDQYTYTFANWNVTPVAVYGPAIYTAVFTDETNEYTITWDIDGIESEVDLLYGETPDYGYTTLFTDEFRYTITGWEPEIDNVTKDQVYVAVFTKVTNKYTITWNVEGTVTTTEVDYGTIPTFDGTPTKAPTDQYTYTFVNFVDELDVEPVEVTGIATYTAQFSHAVNKYTITYKIEGITIKSEEFDYDTLITPLEDLVKDPTPAISYDFEWVGYGLGMKVTKNEVFTAKFTPVDREYTITWNVNGTETTSTVAYGGTPDYGGDPTKAADEVNTYAFTGWSPAIDVVTTDATYTAQFEATAITYYTITWVVFGLEDWDEQVAEGAMPSYGETPIRAADEVNTYVFAGWNTALVVATENATYTAQFEAIPITYTITWIVDGIAVDKTTTVAKNQLPVYGDAPTKAADEVNTYAFTGWSPAIDVVTTDATYTAQFEATAITYYTITWVVFGLEDWDEQVAEGVMPSYGDDPVRAADDEFTYEFTGWNTALVVAAADVMYEAQFEAIPITYTITWVVFGLEDRTEEVAAGVMPSYGETPIRAADDEFTYEFAGWNTELVVATEDATYEAQFNEFPIVYYTITWVVFGLDDRDEQVVAGVMPSYGDDPVRATDGINAYAFDGWNPTLVVAAADVAYEAQFEAIPITYTITWVVEGITENETTQVAKDELPVYGVDPTKDADEVNTYAFAGWNPALDVATEDATYTAEFEAIPIGYTMTWSANGVETTTGPLGYGAEIIAPADPADYFNDRGNYTFLNWEGYVAGETTVDGNMTFEALFEETLNTYTIVFKVGNITFKKVTLAYGADIVAPAAIKKASTSQYDYTFEWVGYTAGMTVTGDKTFSGVFTEVLRSYTITWMIEGVGTTATVNYGVVPVYSGGTPTKDAVGEQTFTFTGWNVVPVAVSGPATYTAQFMGSPV